VPKHDTRLMFGRFAITDEIALACPYSDVEKRGGTEFDDNDHDKYVIDWRVRLQPQERALREILAVKCFYKAANNRSLLADNGG